LRDILAVRTRTPEFAGNRLVDFETHNPHVLGYQRPGADGAVLALANFDDSPQPVAAATLSGFGGDAVDLLTRETVRIAEGLTIPPQDFVWLRVRPA
jgi:amylosucrase